MPHSNPVQVSQGLERELSKSIERMTEQIGKSAAIRRQIKSARRVRKQLEAIPDEVREWFEETEEFAEEE